MYVTTYMTVSRLRAKTVFTEIQYLKLLEFLIFAYVTVHIIQQLCVLASLPVFLQSSSFPNNKWKLGSLSLEPSHFARLLSLFMYCYLTMKETVTSRKYKFKKEWKTDKHLWLAFLWSMLTMGAATAFLFLPFVLLKCVKMRNIVFVAAIIAGLWLVAENISSEALNRTTNTALATLTLDEHKIIEADESAAYRIVPIIKVIKYLGVVSADDLFGHGIDRIKTIVSQIHLDSSEEIASGGLLALWYEYGFLPFVLFVLFSFLSCYRKGDFVAVIFWLFLVFIYGINNQIPWIAIILLTTNKYFTNRKKYENTKNNPLLLVWK
jgi:hypothetical protein